MIQSNYLNTFPALKDIIERTNFVTMHKEQKFFLVQARKVLIKKTDFLKGYF